MSQNWSGTIGLFSSIASSILGDRANRENIKAQNAANMQAWETATQSIRDQLTVAYNRTLTGLYEINRDKIRTQVAAKAAGKKAVGEALVEAAQLGIEGRRGSNKVRGVEREVANTVSDADITASVESENTVNSFNDAAENAIRNLNTQAPTNLSSPSRITTTVNAIGAGLDYYSKLTPSQKSDVRFNFKTIGDATTNALNF